MLIVIVVFVVFWVFPITTVTVAAVFRAVVIGAAAVVMMFVFLFLTSSEGEQHGQADEISKEFHTDSPRESVARR
ncbi:MAG: hypothetical protein C5B50_10505 [Verrucomicrobia bacterium]|nr:MAG: hypothetical protein C5B50_10505 [Verrucomicrobiota bacterium]